MDDSGIAEHLDKGHSRLLAVSPFEPVDTAGHRAVDALQGDGHEIGLQADGGRREKRNEIGAVKQVEYGVRIIQFDVDVEIARLDVEELLEGSARLQTGPGKSYALLLYLAYGQGLPAGERMVFPHHCAQPRLEEFLGLDLFVESRRLEGEADVDFAPLEHLQKFRSSLVIDVELHPGMLFDEASHSVRRHLPERGRQTYVQRA